MSEMVEVLAGTSLFLLAFSLLIFDIPRYTLSLVSLALFSWKRRSASGTVCEATVSVIIRPSTAAPGLLLRSARCAGKPCDLSKSSSSTTAPPTKHARSRSGRERRG